MDKIQNPSTRCWQDAHFRCKDTHRPRVKGWKEAFCPCKGIKKYLETNENGDKDSKMYGM